MRSLKSKRVRQAVLWAGVASGVGLLTASADDVTVRGCLERDAAASAVIYKLIVPAPSTTRIYRLAAPKEIDLSTHVGHTVEVTGSVAAAPSGRGPRQEPALTVKTLTMISQTCSAPVAAAGPRRP